MLLVADIGNTNTVFGVFDGRRLLRHWRTATERSRTADEHAVLLSQLFSLGGLKLGDVRAVTVSCVVPPVLEVFRDVCRVYLGREPLLVGAGMRTAMPILYDNPKEVGADRIANAVAAYETYKSACVVVDFGTATTFDAISARGEYLGGAIAPGIMISLDALFHQTAKLPRVELTKPSRVIGRNTEASIQAGIVYGYVGMVDGIVELMRRELGGGVHTVATGGLAELIGRESHQIEDIDPLLTLRGLSILYERNK